MADFLTGKLLVATPKITEQVFRRSVVIVLHHDAQGAHGLILNKPLGVGVDAVLPGWSAHLTSPAVMFQGGPVGLDTAFGLGWDTGNEDETATGGVQRVVGSIGVVNLDGEPGWIRARTEGVRVFVGYSGWSSGQLESEVAAHSWYVVDAQSIDAFTQAPHELWRTVLRRQPGRLSWVASFPDDPERN
ncbi:MAG: YqgE/AlgH family protein [Dermatophilaceae bacterium]